jgi:uncharacterized protein (TIGR02266 family)
MAVRTICVDIGDKRNADDALSAKHAQRVCPLAEKASILRAMPDERRSARRAPLTGIHATYESASGQRHQVLVSDLSKEGLFLQTESLLAVGKRLSLEISVAGEPAPWAALGRVVWTRSTPDAAGLPGMGVKLIDVEDSVATAIERFVSSRMPAKPAAVAPRPPAREKTMLGVGLAPPPMVTGVARERTVLGIPPPAHHSNPEPSPAETALAPPQASGDSQVAPTREASLTIDLVARREPSDAIDLVAKKSPLPVLAAEERSPAPNRRPVHENAAPVADEEELPRLPKRRTGWVLLVFLIVAAAAVTAYVLQDQLRQRWPRLRFATAICAEPCACEATSAPRQGLSWTARHDERRSEKQAARSEG